MKTKDKQPYSKVQCHYLLVVRLKLAIKICCYDMNSWLKCEWDGTPYTMYKYTIYKIRLEGPEKFLLLCCYDMNNWLICEWDGTPYTMYKYTIYKIRLE